MKNIFYPLIINMLFIFIIKANIINIPADYPTIQTGIDSSMNGDTVLVANGLYYENINFNAKAITVGSLFLIDADTSHISNTIINGSQPISSNRASTVTFSSGEDTTSILIGFTITAGRGTNVLDVQMLVGGGIIIDHSCCKILYNKIIDNTLEFYAGDGVAGCGIAGRLDSTNFVIIENNIISSNIGRGIFAYGGGIFLYGHNNGNCKIINNLIIKNSLSSNLDSYGGGLSCSYITSILMNNTIVNNYCKSYGGGIDLYLSNTSIINTIIWGNETSNSSYKQISNVGSVNINYSNIQDDFVGEGNINKNPLFMDSANNDYSLYEFSPCIGSGIDTIRVNGELIKAPVVDIYGQPRPSPAGSKPDMGVYESVLAIPDHVSLSSSYINPVSDTLVLNALIQNPYNHNIEAKANIVSIDSAFIDSVLLYDDGNHNDGQAGDNLWGGYLNPVNIETEFSTDIKISDLDLNRIFLIEEISRFTSIGPIILEDYLITSSDTIPHHGDNLKFKLILKNNGSIATALNITFNLVGLDSCSLITPVLSDPKYYDIAPGQSVIGSRIQFIEFPLSCPDSIYVDFRVDIASNGYVFWSDTFSVFVHKDPTGIDTKDENLPKEFALKQNYPNPFNPTTTIEFSIPNSEFVTLKIYNLLGQKVATLVSGKLTPGNYKYTWDASDFASGIYYYTIEAGDPSAGSGQRFVESKKLLLIK